jgi:hypothetical protein
MKNKRGRKRIITIAILVIIAGIISAFIFWNMYSEKQKRVKGIITKEEKIKIFKKQENEKNESKKNMGKDGDKTPPKISDFLLSLKTIDCKKRVFPELKMNISDESGIYTIKINFIRAGKKIGYIQKNINSKNKNIKFQKIIDDNIILNNMKTFKEYEGAEISIELEITDNSLNKSIKTIKGLKILDYTKPEIPEFFWTFKSRGKDLEKIHFTKEKKNSFIFKSVEDLPKIEENKIKKYLYAIRDEEKKIIKIAKIPSIEEKWYVIKADMIKDGKYSILLRAYDIAGNFSEKELKFGVDTMEPFVKIDILEGQRFYVGDTVTIKIDAIDTLSGVYRYRIAESKEKLLKSEWEFIEKNVKYQLKEKEGIHEIWCQVQDKAMNISSPTNIAYALVKDRSLKIKSTSNEMKSKERVLRIDKESYKRGKLEIESAEEK